MKKIIWSLYIFTFIGFITYSQNITVTSPRDGDNWPQGSVHNIAWTSSGCTDPEIKINIFKNSIDPENFVEQLICSNCSSKSWRIPAGYTSGNYILRVKTADNKCRGDSGVFTISSKPVQKEYDLGITSAEFCSGKLKVTIKNNGDHYYGKISILLIYDMYGKTRISVPAITKENFILFSGKSLTLTEKNDFIRKAVQTCSMNYILLLIPDKDHKDTNGGNNQYNGVAYKDCEVRNCNKPDLWFEKVWEKKKYQNSSFQAGDNVKILAELRKTGIINSPFTVRVTIYYHEKQFDQWSSVTERRWRIGDFRTKKELSFTFTPQKRGYYIFEWMVDIQNEIEERDEKNNKKNGNEFIWEKR